MGKVTGLGGVFLKVPDPARTRAWYQETLGIGGEWGAVFPFSAAPEGSSTFATFPDTTEYFAPSTASLMVNFRVEDLEGLLADLEAKGIQILGRQDEEYGRFAWILDCDGVKLELWEDAAAAPAA